MTEQPSSNISLTFEQMAQVEETKKRLSNLENEITIATKNLNVLNKETLKATKEREYQEELISGLSGNIEKLVAELQVMADEYVAPLPRIDKIEEAKAIALDTKKIASAKLAFLAKRELEKQPVGEVAPIDKIINEEIIK